MKKVNITDKGDGYCEKGLLSVPIGEVQIRISDYGVTSDGTGEKNL